MKRNYKTTKKAIIALIIATAVLAIFAALNNKQEAKAAINPMVDFTGKVTNADGSVVADETYNFTFSLHTTATSGAAIWSEDLTAANMFSAAISGVTANASSTIYTYNTSSATSTIRAGQYLTNTTTGEYELITDYSHASNEVTVAATTAWSIGETINNRPRTVGGVININLGSVSDLSSINFNQTLYLEVIFNSETMQPRKLLTPAIQAFNADKLDGYDSADFLLGTGDTVITGEWDFNNVLDISTTSTATALTVTQSGTGDIVNIFDGTSEILTILDGGNVGIGTTSPYAKLSVWGDGTSGLTAFNVVDNASSTLFTILDNGYVGIGTSSPLTTLSVQGATGAPIMNIASSTGESILYIDELGKVGIGTMAPGALLDVNGFLSIGDKSSGDVTFTFDGDTGTDGTIIWDVSDDDFNFSSAIEVTGDITSSNFLSSNRTNNSGYLKLQRTDSTPSDDDQVAQILMFGPDSGGVSTLYAGIFAYSDTVADGSEAASLQFYTARGLGGNATETMRISADGYLGIGTSSPLTTLSAQGAAGTPIMNIASSTGESALYVDEYGKVGIGTMSPGSYGLYLSGAEAYCDQTTCWNDASSRDIKENIVQLNKNDWYNILGEIKQTDVYFYNRKEANNDRLYLGVIAEEAPDWFTTTDKKAISGAGFANFLLAGVKGLIEEVEDLKLSISLENNNLINSNNEVNLSPEDIFNFNEEGYLVFNKIKAEEIKTKSLTIEQTVKADENTAGSAVVEAFSSMVIVQNKKITKDSKIFISWLEKLGGIDWWVCNKLTGESFTVCLDKETVAATPFDYWILGVDGVNLDLSQPNNSGDQELAEEVGEDEIIAPETLDSDSEILDAIDGNEKNKEDVEGDSQPPAESAAEENEVVETKTNNENTVIYDKANSIKVDINNTASSTEDLSGQLSG